MRPIAWFAFALLVLRGSPGAGGRCFASDEEDLRAAVKDWNSVLGGDDYKVDPYIRGAEALQKMGKEKACQVLAAATAKDTPPIPVQSLCRLVFKPKKDGEFRRAAIGAVGFLGGTGYKDRPLDPFEVVDGVPFVITDGTWLLGGRPESDKAYLEYCMKECDWNDVKLTTKTAKEKEAAVEKLIASDRWKKVLTNAERERLRAQIK